MPRGGPRVRADDGRMNLVGARVAARRQELGLDQDDLCARLARASGGRWNPGWQDVSRIENGARIVSDVEVWLLSDALECDPCWLLSGAGSTDGRNARNVP